MTRWVAIGVIALVGVGRVGALAAQNPPAPPSAGLLLGTVIDAQSRAPIAGATVSLALIARGTAPPRQQTDAQGRFLFNNVPLGKYRVLASASGYLEGAFGQSRVADAMALRTSSPTVDVQSGVARGDVQIPLWRAPSIKGRVTDERGAPLPGLRVSASPASLDRSMSAMLGRPNVAQTDDRGEYVIGGLRPGDYKVGLASSPMMTRPMTSSLSAMVSGLVAKGAPSGIRVGTLWLFAPGAAEMRGERIWVRPATFWPDAPTPAEAQVITLRAGDARTGVDLASRFVPTRSVSGRVVSSEGPASPVSIDAIFLAPAAVDDIGAKTDVNVGMAELDTAGAFTFLGVPPGDYVVHVGQMPRPTNPMGGPSSPTAQRSIGWTRTPVTVGDRDVTGVTATLRPGLKVRGRVIVEAKQPAGGRGSNATAPLEKMPILLQPRTVATSGGSGTATLELSPDGTFEAGPFLPGTYEFEMTSSSGWALGSLRVGGRTTMVHTVTLQDDLTVELVVTDRLGTVNGSVTGATSTGLPPTVLLFPTDRQAWARAELETLRVRRTDVAAAGEFSFGNVPAGDYFLVATSEDLPPTWQAARVLDRLSSTGARVTLRDGETKTVNVPVTGAR